MFTLCAGLSLAGCAAMSTTQATGVLDDFGDLLSPRIDLRSVPRENLEDLRLILAALGTAKANGSQRFDVITRVSWVSATRAEIYFTWSSGFHGGSFSMEKKSGAWVITSEAYLL